MKFSQLAIYIEKIESTSQRLTITKLLADLFKKLSEDEIDKTVYLLSGRVVPQYENIEFGVAEKMVAKSIASALNVDKNYFVREFRRLGDLGLAVESFKKQKSTLSFEEKDLTIVEVYEKLYDLATRGGAGSQEQKINILAQLFRQLDPLSCRYIARIPIGTLRLGFSDMTVLDALSWMSNGTKELRPKIEHAYHVRPDLGFIAATIKQKGPSGFTNIRPVVFTPIIMMRAERLSSGEEIIEKIGECSVEPKYDGFRLQVHYTKGKGRRGKGEGDVKIYTRNLEEVTFMYPDIVEAILKQVDAREIIFEGEAIAYEPSTGRFLAFQETVQRKRKHNIEEVAKKIPLKLFVFELLLLDGQSYLAAPFAARRRKLQQILRASADPKKHTIIVAQDELVKTGKKLDQLFEEYIAAGLEGVIAKKPTGVYQPGARGWNWIKFKRSYTSNIDDTIDCLVMGYDYGRGKRTGFGIGAFLVGVYDKRHDGFVTIAKIGTGLTDEEWKRLKVQSAKFKVQKKPNNYNVDEGMKCDIWISPKIVVEIRADEITRSPVHTAGRILKRTKSGNSMEVDEPGYALRFPRLERFRDDKKPADATTIEEVESLYKKQSTTKK